MKVTTFKYIALILVHPDGCGNGLMDKCGSMDHILSSVCVKCAPLEADIR
jgi:hypothetical protein